MSTELPGRRKTAMYLHPVRELLYNIDWPSGRLLTYWHFVHVYEFRARVTYILWLSRLQVRETLGVRLRRLQVCGTLGVGLTVGTHSPLPIPIFCQTLRPQYIHPPSHPNVFQGGLSLQKNGTHPLVRIWLGIGFNVAPFNYDIKLGVDMGVYGWYKFLYPLGCLLCYGLIY